MMNSSQWTKEIAAEIAKEEGIELTDKHFELIDFIRNKVEKGEALTIRGIGKSGIVDIKGFYQLFPGAPLKKATKISGVPKPASCI
jgi:tRNA 2-thiouridine synthesizing protein E